MADAFKMPTPEELIARVSARLGHPGDAEIARTLLRLGFHAKLKDREDAAAIVVEALRLMKRPGL